MHPDLFVDTLHDFCDLAKESMDWLEGKTQMILNLLKHKLFIDDVEQVIYCIPAQSSHLESVKRTIEQLKQVCKNLIVFESLLTSIESVFHPRSQESKCIAIFDDLFSDAVASKDFSQLVTHNSRKNNVSLILTTQNLTEPGMYSRTIRRNFQESACFKQLSTFDHLVLWVISINQVAPLDCSKRAAFLLLCFFNQKQSYADDVSILVKSC